MVLTLRTFSGRACLDAMLGGMSLRDRRGKASAVLYVCVTAKSRKTSKGKHGIKPSPGLSSYSARDGDREERSGVGSVHGYATLSSLYTLLFSRQRGALCDFPRGLKQAFQVKLDDGYPEMWLASHSRIARNSSSSMVTPSDLRRHPIHSPYS